MTLATTKVVDQIKQTPCRIQRRCRSAKKNINLQQEKSQQTNIHLTCYMWLDLHVLGTTMDWGLTWSPFRLWASIGHNGHKPIWIVLLISFCSQELKGKSFICDCNHPKWLFIYNKIIQTYKINIILSHKIIVFAAKLFSRSGLYNYVRIIKRVLTSASEYIKEYVNNWIGFMRLNTITC